MGIKSSSFFCVRNSGVRQLAKYVNLMYIYRIYEHLFI